MSQNDERRPAKNAVATLVSSSEVTSRNGDRLLTAAELGAYLGLAASTILDRFERGDLPGFKLWGKHGPVRFRASDVAEFLSECRVETKARAA